MTGSAAPESWDDAVLRTQHHPHFMQSLAWAQFKTGSGWEPSGEHLRNSSGVEVLAVQEFTRPAFGLGNLIHAPRVSGMTPEKVEVLTERAKQLAGGKNLAYKIETYQETNPELIAAYRAHGWLEAYPSQYQWSVTIDLSPDEETMFAGFGPKARNHLRFAMKADIDVARVPFSEENIVQLLELVGGTKDRSGAFFRSEDYLRKAWGTFDAAGQARLYMAHHEGTLIAAAVVFTFGKKAWYKDGGSIRTQKRLPAPHLMQWTIMRELKAEGFEAYDLGNVPDPENITAGAMEGLWHFKTGFNSTVDSYMPAFEYPLNSKQRLWNKFETKFLALYSRLRKDYWY